MVKQFGIRSISMLKVNLQFYQMFIRGKCCRDKKGHISILSQHNIQPTSPILKTSYTLCLITACRVNNLDNTFLWLDRWVFPESKIYKKNQQNTRYRENAEPSTSRRRCSEEAPQEMGMQSDAQSMRHQRLAVEVYGAARAANCSLSHYTFGCDIRMTRRGQIISHLIPFLFSRNASVFLETQSITWMYAAK